MSEADQEALKQCTKRLRRIFLESNGKAPLYISWQEDRLWRKWGKEQAEMMGTFPRIAAPIVFRGQEVIVRKSRLET